MIHIQPKIAYFQSKYLFWLLKRNKCETFLLSTQFQSKHLFLVLKRNNCESLI